MANLEDAPSDANNSRQKGPAKQFGVPTAGNSWRDLFSSEAPSLTQAEASFWAYPQYPDIERDPYMPGHKADGGAGDKKKEEATQLNLHLFVCLAFARGRKLLVDALCGLIQPRPAALRHVLSGPPVPSVSAQGWWDKSRISFQTF